MGFHDDVRGLLTARGWSAARASLEAGLYQSAVGSYLRTGAYPRLPDIYPRLATTLGAPPDAAAIWAAEAEVSGNPWTKPSANRRGKPGRLRGARTVVPCPGPNCRES